MQNYEKKREVIKMQPYDKFVGFGIRCLNLVEQLKAKQAHEYERTQLFQAITSAWASFEEAREVDSNDDYRQKMQLVLNELQEVLCWLSLIQKTQAIAPEKINTIINDIKHISGYFQFNDLTLVL